MNILNKVKKDQPSAFSEWEPTTPIPQVTTIILVTIIIMALSIYFYVKVKNIKDNESLTGLALIIEMFVNWTRNLVVDVLGVKFIKITPYFIYLLMYICIGNLTSIIGLEPPVTSYTVPLSMGIITFIGIFVVGIKYQRFSFFRKFFINVKIKNINIPMMVNPFAIIGEVSTLVSITFRLWGNITAGSIILAMLYVLTGYITSLIPIIGAFNFLGVAIAPPFHGFFDLFEGVIQSMVFTLLTMIYWSLETHVENAVEENKIKVEEKALNVSSNQELKSTVSVVSAI